MSHPRARRSVLAPLLIATLFTAARDARPGEDAAPAAPHIVVAQDGSGDVNGATGAAIQQAVDRAHAQGGGVVLIRPGTYTLRRELDLSGKRNITLLGSAGAILKAAKQLIGTTAQDAPAGQAFIALTEPLAFVPNVMLEIRHPGRTTITPSGKKYTQPFVMARVARVEGRTVHLTSPLRFPVAKGKKVIAVFNGIVVRGKAARITIENLTIDMNRSQWPLRPLNHTYHCALIAGGPYSYEKGPTGPPVEGLRIVRCRIRNAHQRGIAFYSVVHSGVYRCQLEHTGAEGIDFDHFAYHCEAVGNPLDGRHNTELNDASDCLIADNRITRCHMGIVVWQWCKLPGLNERNLIIGNRITASRSDGIRLQAGADLNHVVGNVVRDVRGAGIRIEGARNVVTDNDVADTGEHGIRLAGKGNVALRNRCLNFGRKKPNTYAGIAILGSGNRAEENTEGRPSEAPPGKK